MKCAIYMRVAHGEPAIDAVDRCAMQRNTLMEYAREHGLEVVEKYWDIGFSGNTLERPGLQAMLADHAAGKFDRVLVVDMSRLTRKPMAFPFIIETVK